jgi:hypothetical protein
VRLHPTYTRESRICVVGIVPLPPGHWCLFSVFDGQHLDSLLLTARTCTLFRGGIGRLSVGDNMHIMYTMTFLNPIFPSRRVHSSPTGTFLYEPVGMSPKRSVAIYSVNDYQFCSCATGTNHIDKCDLCRTDSSLR